MFSGVSGGTLIAPRTTASPECLAAHPDGVDLVDEDDAGAPPHARRALHLPGEVADDDRVDADERRGEAGAGIETNGELNPVATPALASIVLPVPGGPKNSTPRSRLPPWRSNCSPDCQIETTRRTSSFASAWPRTSSSFTPHCASPGSNVLICVRFIARSGPNRIPKLAMKKTKTT